MSRAHRVTRAREAAASGRPALDGHQESASIDSLAEAVREAKRSMLCFVIPDRVGRFPTRLFGRTPISIMRVNLGLAAACPGLALLLLLWQATGGPDLWNFTSGYVLYYFVLHLALLAVPQDSWRRLEGIAPDIDAVILDVAERARFATIVRQTLRLDVQLVLGIVGFVAGAIGAAAAARARGLPIEAAVPFELSIGVTMFLGSNVVVWIVSGVQWLGVASRLKSVRFDSVDPLRSAGLKNMYDLLGRAQWYCTGGLLLSLAPLVLLYNETRDSTFLHTVVVIAACGSLVVVLLAYTLPPWYLHTLRVSDKEALLDALREELPEKLASLDSATLAVVAPKLELYEKVRARPTGGIDRHLVTSLIAAVVTLTAAFLPLLAT